MFNFTKSDKLKQTQFVNKSISAFFIYFVVDAKYFKKITPNNQRILTYFKRKKNPYC